MEIIAFMVAGVAITSLAASLCAGIEFNRREIGQFFAKTLAPMTTRDFLLPPCFICWAVRGLVVLLIVQVATGAVA